MTRKRALGIAAGLIVLSLMPLYIMSYVGIILLAAALRPFKTKIFESYVSRVIFVGLLFGATIMTAGMYAWLLKGHFYPVLPTIIFILCTWLVHRSYPHIETHHIVNRSDVLSFSGALVGVAATVVTFLGVSFGLPSTIQFITNGFDNGAHISLVDTTYKGDGYVYGPYQTIKDQIAWKTLTAYPQGWHLATMSTLKGLGINFASTNVEALFMSYMVVFIVWMVVAVYLMNKIVLELVETIADKRHALRNADVATVLFASLFIQVLVFWGIQYFGFITFLCAIAYFMILIAVLKDMYDSGSSKWLHIAVLIHIMSAIAQSWLLPVVIAGLMSLFVFMWVNKNISGVIKFLKTGRVTHYLLSVALILPAIAIVGVSRAFSVQGPSQINDEGGIFVLSSLLVGGIIIATLVAIVNHKKFIAIRPFFLSIIVPLLMFVGLVYVYQMNTLGHTAYFFTKITALLLVVVWVFSSALLIDLVSGLTFSNYERLTRSLIVVSLLVTAVVYSGQYLGDMRHVIPKGAQMKTSTAQSYAQVARDGRLKQTNVIVFTRVSPQAFGADVTGNVLSTSINTKIHPCVGDSIWLITDSRSAEFPAWVDRCAREHDQKITIITSAETDSLIRAFNNPNIATVTQP